MTTDPSPATGIDAAILDRMTDTLVILQAKSASIDRGKMIAALQAIRRQLPADAQLTFVEGESDAHIVREYLLAIERTSLGAPDARRARTSATAGRVADILIRHRESVDAGPPGLHTPRQPVTGELVREVNGRIVFGDAVGRIAETLNPLGAAARVVAEAGAVGAELRRLALEGRQIEADRLEALLRLEDRRVAAGETIHDMHRIVDDTEHNARQLRQCIANAQREILARGVSVAEKEIYCDILKDLTAALVHNHASSGHALTGHIHEILNGAEAPAPKHPGNAALRGQAKRPSTGQQRRAGRPPPPGARGG